MNGVCGEEAVTEALSAAVAEAQRLVEEEREMEMEKRLGRNSRVYNELQRQKKEALDFWYHLQESAQMAAASKELQKEFGLAGYKTPSYPLSQKELKKAVQSEDGANTDLPPTVKGIIMSLMADPSDKASCSQN